jgi:hypothetical protein
VNDAAYTVASVESGTGTWIVFDGSVIVAMLNLLPNQESIICELKWELERETYTVRIVRIATAKYMLLLNVRSQKLTNNKNS